MGDYAGKFSKLGVSEYVRNGYEEKFYIRDWEGIVRFGNYFWFICFYGLVVYVGNVLVKYIDYWLF